ncbi:MAG: alpha/beta hydrolase [Actinobacteria bacterium]|nr:MAG: alpha/beta hydrolase [Actinomycetota bacterium]
MALREERHLRRDELVLGTGDKTTHIDLYDIDDALSTVIFYHGNITFAAFYHNFLEELASRGHRVLAPDRAGMGRSSGKRGSFTVEDLWNQANGTMDLIADRYEPPYLVIGHSVGGTLAFEHFLSDPRLKACVAGNIRHPSSEAKGIRDRIELALFKLSARLTPWVQVDTLGVVESEMEGMSEPDRICMRRVMAEDGSEHRTKEFTMGSLAAYVNFRAQEDHGRIDRPLLLLIGDLDSEQELWMAREAAAEIEGPVTLEIVPGAGHFLLETDYERSAEIVDEWLHTEGVVEG